MKKQLAIIINTLILVFGLSSCAKQIKNTPNIKKSLNLNVVKTNLDINHFDSIPIDIFNFSKHSNYSSWNNSIKTIYEKLDSSNTWDSLFNYSDGKKYLELSKSAINLIYLGINKSQSGATTWWCINDCSKYLNINFIVQYISDNFLVNQVQRIIINKIKFKDKNHLIVDDFFIVDNNNHLHQYRNNQINLENEGNLKHIFNSPILRSQGWRNDNYSSMCFVSGDWLGSNYTEGNIVGYKNGIDVNIQCYVEFSISGRTFGGVKKALNYFPIITWNDQKTVKLGAKLIIGRNGNNTNKWDQLKVYGELHYYTIFFKYNNETWWFKYGSHDGSVIGADREDSKDSLIKRKNPSQWYKITEFNGLIYRSYITSLRYQEYYVVGLGNKLFFKTKFYNNFPNENELGVLYIKYVYE